MIVKGQDRFSCANFIGLIFFIKEIINFLCLIFFLMGTYFLLCLLLAKTSFKLSLQVSNFEGLKKNQSWSKRIMRLCLCQPYIILERMIYFLGLFVLFGSLQGLPLEVDTDCTRKGVMLFGHLVSFNAFGGVFLCGLQP